MKLETQMIRKSELKEAEQNFVPLAPLPILSCFHALRSEPNPSIARCVTQRTSHTFNKTLQTARWRFTLPIDLNYEIDLVGAIRRV